MPVAYSGSADGGGRGSGNLSSADAAFFFPAKPKTGESLDLQNRGKCMCGFVPETQVGRASGRDALHGEGLRTSGRAGGFSEINPHIASGAAGSGNPEIQPGSDDAGNWKGAGTPFAYRSVQTAERAEKIKENLSAGRRRG